MAAGTYSQPTGFFQTRRGRILKQNLTAYAFLLPAGFLIFLFGIFPVAFAFFVSLHRWRTFPGDYLGLANYEKAFGNMGYMLFFWIAVGSLTYGLVLLWRLRGRIREDDDATGWVFALPGIINTASILLFLHWFFQLLLDVMEIPRRIRGQETSLDLFMSEFNASFNIPEILETGNLMLVVTIVAFGVSIFAFRTFKTRDNVYYLLRWTAIALLIVGFYFVMQLTLSEIQLAIAGAQESGEPLPIWSQLVMITLGVAMLGGAYVIFQRGIKQFENNRFAVQVVAGLVLAAGAYILMAELPAALGSADDDLLSGFQVTVLYSIGTVPLQLGIGLLLAYLLFQKIRFRSFFRMMYFIPYITPFVATSIVFRILFSPRETSLANRLIGMIGIEPQQWLIERASIGELIFGAGVPEWLAGPSLALIVIILFSTWTYIGYDAVIFLAGLGNISGDLYEAARIDGASGWRIFRHITLPLLSPTTFFLTLIAVIGTFKAFTQIWILRTTAAGPTVDTASIYIFEQLRSNSRYGYASSMAFILFAAILVLTIFQNRVMGRKVFYG